MTDEKSTQRSARRVEQLNQIAQRQGFPTWTRLETAVINGADIEIRQSDRRSCYGFGRGPMHTMAELHKQGYRYQQEPPMTIWWTISHKFRQDIDVDVFMESMRAIFQALGCP